MKDRTAQYTADDADDDVAPNLLRDIALCAKTEMPTCKTAEEAPYDEAQHVHVLCRCLNMPDCISAAPLGAETFRARRCTVVALPGIVSSRVGGT